MRILFIPVSACKLDSSQRKAEFIQVTEWGRIIRDFIYLTSNITSLRTASPTERPAERPEGLEALEGMAAGLYSEAFNAIVALINRYVV